MWLADLQTGSPCPFRCFDWMRDKRTFRSIAWHMIFYKSLYQPQLFLLKFYFGEGLSFTIVQFGAESEKSHARTCASILRPLTWSGACTRALSSNCREVSTRPLRIFRLESVGGGQRLNWVTITMRRRQHAGECALGRGPFPWPSPAVCGGICQDIYPQSAVISFSLGDDWVIMTHSLCDWN